MVEKTPVPMDKLKLTITQAAQRLCRTRQWVHDLINRGKLPNRKDPLTGWKYLYQKDIAGFTPGKNGRPKKSLGNSQKNLDNHL